MGIEQTLLIVKPDGVRRGLVGEILARVERKGYRLEQMCEMVISQEVASKHYGEHKGKPFYDDLIEYITGGPSVVAMVTGENAIENVRMIMGSTDPLDATPGSIRGAYATSVTHNLVHGSDSSESAEREIKLFFPDHTAR